MNIFQFMAEAGLSGVGILAFFVFRLERKVHALEEKLERLSKPGEK